MILINVTLFYYRFSAGDYRVILVDFKLSDIAKYRVKICSLGMRRLIYKNKVAVEKHNMKALELLQFHEIDEKLDKIEEVWENKDEFSRVVKLDNINVQVTNLLLNSEKRCRKLRTGKVNFLP